MTTLDKYITLVTRGQTAFYVLLAEAEMKGSDPARIFTGEFSEEQV